MSMSEKEKDVLRSERKKERDSLKPCLSCGSGPCICSMSDDGNLAAHCQNCNRSPSGFIGASMMYETRKDAVDAWNDQESWVDPKDCSSNNSETIDWWKDHITMSAKERAELRKQR